jgi:hypothetical protein
MLPTPRSAIDDQLVAGRACAICGTVALAVRHVAGVPDHVACGKCGSIFVIEGDGERVMYGKIPAEYPATRKFALKQWVWFDAVERRAAQERRAGGGRPPMADAAAPRPTEPLPPSPVVPRSAAPVAPRAAPTAAPPPAFVQRPPPPAMQAAPAAAAVPAAKPAPAAAQPVPKGLEPFEPPPGARHRVVIRGERVLYPANTCAHCLRSPTSGRMAVVSRAAAGRRAPTFNIPLCQSCLRRAAARPEGERSARLQAHLIAILFAMIVIVGSLAIGVVDLTEDLLFSAMFLGILAVLGYGIPALFLLSRAGRGPRPADAVFVRTTVQIPIEGTAMEVPFDWRNRRYAELFYNANREWATAGVTTIEEAPPAPKT